MRKYLGALAASAASACIVVWAATGASAHSNHYYPGCHCGPVSPTTHVSTVHTAKAETRFHDVNMFRHVVRIHHVTDVTRIQPIIHIHEVTRIHHHTIVETRDAYHHVTEHLTPIAVYTHSVHNYYDCHCGY